MKFSEHLTKIDIELSQRQLEQFEIYYNFLVEYNKNVNLTAITQQLEVYIKHFYDCLTLSKVYDFSKETTLCDVGAGAGFPSIPLKILYPNIKLTIVDSLGKRITFLNLLAQKLGITNYKMVHARAEEFAKTNREVFDIVTARAVAKQNMLNELCIPLVKVGGYFLSMKAIETPEENDSSFSMLNARVEDVFKFSLPYNLGERTVLKINHFDNAPSTYPRDFAAIKKKPL